MSQNSLSPISSNAFTMVPRAVGGRVRAVVSGALMVVMLGVGPGAFGQNLKVGFVNVPKVLDTAPQAAAARSIIEREFAPRDQKLLKKQKRLRQLEDKLIRDRDVMSARERRKLERDIRTMKRELRREQGEFRDDLNLRRNEEFRKLQGRVVSAIRSLAKSEKFDLVIGDGVLFASSRMDITAKVLARLKREAKK